MGVVSATSTAQLGEPLLPKGEDHTDEYFGTQEIYRGKVEVPVPFTIPGVRPAEARARAAAAGLRRCRPVLSAAEVEDGSRAASGRQERRRRVELAARQEIRRGAATGDFLPPDEAFRFGAGLPQPDSIPLTWVIADGYYLYKDKISVETTTPNVQIGKPVLPQGKPKHDEYFGDTEVYYEVLEATLPIARAASSEARSVQSESDVPGLRRRRPLLQPDHEGSGRRVAADVQSRLSCLPMRDPQRASTSAAPMVAEQDKLAAALQGDNLLYALLTFFVAGLMLSLTPCVLPMIPILSGIIVGQGENVTRTRSFSLAFTYVQGMALTYAAAGAIFVLAFKQAPQAFFQQPWIVTLMVLLFVALAFAMFGAYNLQLPSALQTRLTDASNRQKSGTYVGTFVMGALSALVVTACVAPAIIAALSVISQSRQVLRGAAALYATGLGMGVPLLIVGASAGDLLPKAGPWMDTVKQLFGVMFLGVAIYLAAPLLPAALTMLLWAGAGDPVRLLDFLAEGARRRACAGAVARRRTDCGRVRRVAVDRHGVRQPRSAATAGSFECRHGRRRPQQEHALAFQRIKTVDDLERAVASATAAGKPVMLDFYADWCVSCKEMETFTFTDAAVQAALAGAVLLQADVTANDDADKALLARFEIFGPPTIAFFGADGVERKNFRLVGFAPAPRFAEHVKAAFASLI